jgi:hypothetical protein
MKVFRVLSGPTQEQKTVSSNPFQGVRNSYAHRKAIYCLRCYWDASDIKINNPQIKKMLIQVCGFLVPLLFHPLHITGLILSKIVPLSALLQCKLRPKL